MSPRRARAANRTCRHGEGRGAAFPLVLFSLNDLRCCTACTARSKWTCATIQIVKFGCAPHVRPTHAEKAAVQKGVGGVEREPPQPRPNAAIDCG
jgi:hypothetical protein